MNPLPVDQWNASLQHIVDDMGGEPLNIHCLLANHPALLNAWWSYRMYSVAGGDLEQRECELVILRVAVRTKTWYEWAAHVDRGLTAGLSLTEINRVAGDPGSGDWEPQDELLLSGVDELFDQHRIEHRTRLALSEFFSTQQIMDIISLHGMYVTLAGMISTWDLDLDEPIAARLPASVTPDGFLQRLSSADRD